MKAVILAGGNGTRMYPLTNAKPKPLLYVGGKPIIEHLYNMLKNQGIDDIIVIVKYKREELERWAEKRNIILIEQDIPGTGGAVLAAKDYVNEFIAIAGDNIIEEKDLEEFISSIDGTTVACKEMDASGRYGLIEEENGKIKRIIEKPDKGYGLVNTSLYYFEKDIFEKLEKIDKVKGELRVTDAIKDASIYRLKGYWKDLGYPWDLLEGNEFLLKRYKKGNKECKGPGIVIAEEDVEIEDCYVEGVSYIMKGSKIGPNSYLRGYNTIGKGVEIGFGTTVKNSIIFDNVKAKHLNYIGDSIISNNVNFGAGAITANYRFDGQKIKFDGKIKKYTERNKLGAIIGNDTKLGANSTIMPGKVIGSNVWIGANKVINKYIEDNKKII